MTGLVDEMKPSPSVTEPIVSLVVAKMLSVGCARAQVREGTKAPKNINPALVPNSIRGKLELLNNETVHPTVAYQRILQVDAVLFG